MNSERDIHILFRDKYKSHWQTDFLNDVERLKNGEPLDFVVGWMPFLKCKIDLRYRPLIPRPETEYWTELAVKKIKKLGDVKVLDIFSGSGAIGIAVLKHCKKAKVDFGEFEPELIKQITYNLKLNKLNGKTTKVFCSDIFENIKDKYDFILANPPYIPIARKNKVHTSVIKYEKSSSLWGGKDGLFFIKKFLRGAKAHLLPSGEIWMEFDSPEKNKIATLCQNLGYGFTPKKDQYNKWRYAVIHLNRQPKTYNL